MNAEVVGLAAVSGGFYALTTDKPVLFTGSDPSTILQQELGCELACVSARSIASSDAGVIYAAERGLAFLSNAGADSLLTEKLYTEEQWGDLFTDSSNIIGALCNGDYLFCEQGEETLYVLDISAGTIVPYVMDDPITCMWYDAYTSVLYIALQTADTQTKIYSWQTGDDVEYSWTSREMDIPQGACFSCAKIMGEQSLTAPVSLTIRVDGTSNWVLNQSITSENAFRLPAGWHSQFEITLSGQAAVQGVLLATSMGELHVG